MADQNITELPIKTNSGVASTDYMLGIDSAEGYQILVRDVAKYIVENYNGSTILGSAQTVNDAFNTVNSNAYMLNRQNYITSGNLDTFTTCGIYNSSTSGQTANIEGQPTGHPTAGFKLLVEYLGNNTIVKQTIVYNGGETYQRIKSGTSSWSTWQLQPTRAEITELNSNLQTVLPTQTTERGKTFAEHIQLLLDAGKLPIGKPFFLAVTYYEKGQKPTLGYLYLASNKVYGTIFVPYDTYLVIVTVMQGVVSQKTVTLS